jgi:hypothetical protein
MQKLSSPKAQIKNNLYLEFETMPNHVPKSYPKLTPPYLKQAKVYQKKTQPNYYAFNVGLPKT